MKIKLIIPKGFSRLATGRVIQYGDLYWSEPNRTWHVAIAVGCKVGSIGACSGDLDSPLVYIRKEAK